MSALEVKSTPVVRETLEETIARLEDFVMLMEERYEISSESVVKAVAQGEMKETAEVGKWLSYYQNLQRLRAVHGGETGIHTTDTA